MKIKNKINSVIAKLLILILLFQTGGMLIVFKIHQSYVQVQISYILEINETSFEKINLTVKEYLNCKINSREICLKGKMYDIKSVNISGEQVELLAVHDSKEEKILKRIKDFSSKEKTPNNSLYIQLQQLFLLSYLIPDNHSLLVTSIPVKNIPDLKWIELVHNTDIPSPPPKGV